MSPADNMADLTEGAIKHTENPDKGVHTDAELAMREGMWDEMSEDDRKQMEELLSKSREEPATNDEDSD